MQCEFLQKMTTNLFALNKVIIFEVYKNVDVARKNESNGFVSLTSSSSLSLLKGGFGHIYTYGSISHAQRFRLFIRSHEAIATAIKQYKCMHEGKKKDENPPLYRLYAQRMRLSVCTRACVCVFCRVEFRSLRSYRTIWALAMPCERCVSHHQGMPHAHSYSADTLVYPSFAHSHARSHTLTCTWHSFQLSGHTTCMIRTLFTHCTVKVFSCLAYNVYWLDIQIRIYRNMYDSCCFDRINMKYLLEFSTLFPELFRAGAINYWHCDLIQFN